MEIQERTSSSPLTDIERRALVDVLTEAVEEKLRHIWPLPGDQKSEEVSQKEG